MKESVRYLAILEERYARGFAIGYARGYAIGFIRGVRKAILRHGHRRFGQPTAEVLAAIESISDLGLLDAIIDRLYEVSTWEDLLSASLTARS